MRLLLRSMVLLPIALAGCSWFHDIMGPDKDEFAPPCPRATLIQNLADLTRFRSDTGRDLTDMAVQGRIIGLGGSCRFTARGSTSVEATVTVSAEFQRGPAMQGRETTVPVFIAVTESGTVLDKRIIDFPVAFPPNVDHVALTSQTIRLVLPTTAAKSPAAFSIVGGFQLTPAELATNKQLGAGR